MNEAFEALGPAKIGERLRTAREAANITQAAAASAINVARTTIVAIEQGQRRPRVDELQRLAGIYGTSVNALLRAEAIHVDLRPRFRKESDKDEDVEAAAALLNTLVQAEVELENLLGVRRTRNDPPERPLLPGDPVSQAEQDAAELRQWLGLGLAPVHDMVALLELHLGVRIYVRRLPPKISGLYAFDERVGACMLLNAAHPRDRRAQSAAHETGHFTSTRYSPDALHEKTSESSREERYANAFAKSFLTPSRAVVTKFRELTAGAAKLTRRHIIILAHSFGVSREAMVRRLEELHLTKVGTWDWFQENGGITDNQAREVLGAAALHDVENADAARPIPIRLDLLTGEAWHRGLLSEGQIARMLHIDRIEARQLIDGYDSEGVLNAEAPRLRD